MSNSPSAKRESALSEMLGRLGSAQTKDDRYNNGQAHFSLAVFTSWIRAFEARMNQIVSKVEASIIAATAIPGRKDAKPDELIGKSISLDQPLFLNSMSLTQWIENFYQESPSINARAREDQVKIGMEAFKTPAYSTWMSAEEDAPPDAD